MSMRKKNKYLKFYEAYYGLRMPNPGLCNVFRYDQKLDMFEPTADDYAELWQERYDGTWWGSGMKYDEEDKRDKKRYGFTPLRQTIVLFMAMLKEGEYA